MIRSWIGLFAILILGLVKVSASAAQDAIVFMSCTVTVEFFEPSFSGVPCSGEPGGTRWVFFETVDGSAVDSTLVNALVGRQVSITCTLSNLASAEQAFDWQQSPGGFYLGAIHATGKSFATFVNPDAVLIFLSGETEWVKARCTLFSAGLTGISSNTIVKRLILHLD